MPTRHRRSGVPEVPDLGVDDLRGRTPAELQRAMADLDRRLSDLHTDDDGELRQLDEAEQARFDRLMRVRDAAAVRLREHEVMANAYARGAETHRAYGNLAGQEVLARDCGEVLRMAGDELRSAALRTLEAFGNNFPAAAQDRVADTVSARLGPSNPYLDGEYVARRLLITESPEYRSAFMRVMTQDHPLLTEGESGRCARSRSWSRGRWRRTSPLRAGWACRR
jgi:hypothetical protein